MEEPHFKAPPGPPAESTSFTLTLIMDGTTVTDFSIERILSPQLGLKPQSKHRAPDGYLQGIPGGFSPDYTGLFRPPGAFTVPVPVPVPASVPGCLQYSGMKFGEPFYGVHHRDFSFHPNTGVYLRYSQQDPTGYQCYHQAAVSAQPQQQQQQRQKPRMRTVFTDSQSKQLEALFESTDYPTVDARADVARRTGLSEETVRVWFKNRRARRKRQRSGSKVKSPSPHPSTGAERRIFSSFL
ncbi:homeobox protein goosecoid-like isoform X2 [Notolabrus celidotus]|uniref:homeobox protein goosecoid-like isoform X2 n=1 Tax=Notolabrus celidotus TaxID=1203425 RepID=UPI00148F526B|nr:homeobox protein goosecoid-like isoform X2 [Notolabrus celidotus]